jgi:RNA polymerase sigma-70 factor (ECF subfamily)
MDTEDTPADILDSYAIRAQGGDREAFRLLFGETQLDLRIYIAAHARSRDQADEILQATYVAAFEHLHQYRPAGALRSWLKSIARNRMIDEWRQGRRMAALESLPLDEMLATEAIDELSAEDTAEAAALLTKRLALCVERLPKHAQKLLSYRYQEGMPLSDMARRFKRTADAIGVALYRIRQGLRKCLESRA